MSAADELRRAALAYAAHGWPVFPLRGKLPALSKAAGGQGFKDASTDADMVETMWARFPGANIGIATGAVSGLAVLDIDGEPGRRSLAAIEAEHGPLPGTVTSVTSSGCHLLYRWPSGLGIGARRYGAGLDHRGDGGYIVAPPSVHESGHVYRWLTADDSDSTPWAHPLPAWPSSALPVSRVTQPTSRVVVPLRRPGGPFARLSGGGGSLAGLVRTVLDAPEGSRNTVLNWAAWKVGQDARAGRLDLTEGVAALTLAAERAGLGAVEIRGTIASGIASGVAAGEAA